MMGNSFLLVLLLSFMFHLNSQLTSSSPSSPSPAVNSNSPFLCHPHQAQALLQFKSSFAIDIDASQLCERYSGVPSYPKTESWKEDADCCSSWDGVTCDEVTGHVIGLDLSCSQLVGTIHSNSSLFSSHIAPYLQRLNLAYNGFHGSNMSSEFAVKFGSSLTHLNLSRSGFDGNIPTEISLLSHLVSLDLSLSYFRGNIPPEISHLSNLVSLDLSANLGLRVESDRVLERIAQNLTHLRKLDLSWVNMSSLVHASSSLMNLSSSLTSLRLYVCRLQGQFPASFLLRPNLQELDLSYNRFSAVTSLPDFNSTTPSHNLTVLGLGNTDLSSVLIDFLDFVANLKSLRTLYLRNCSLNGPIPIDFCSMNQLKYLDLGYNQLNGMLPSCLFDIPSLESLCLNDNKLHGQIPTSLSQSMNLAYLELSSNNLSGSFDFHMLLDLKKLEFLSLSHNHLSSSTSMGYNLSHSLSSLRYVSLSFCNLTEFPSFLKALPNLTYVDISNNNIQGPIPQWMFDVANTDFSKNSLASKDMLYWKNIQSLDFHSNQLQGHIPVPPITTQFFSVSNNNFSGEIPSLICNVTSLEVFDLSHNHFVGLIPPCLGSLSNLSVLDLGENNLHGTIPNTFINDSNLNYLILNQNQLRGGLPRSLLHCQYLEVLDVGNNMLEDVFPHWLQTLSTLQVLVLRSNKFFGSIDGIKSHFSFTNLRILDVSNNNLIGRLPTRLIRSLEAMMNVHEGIGNSGGYMVASNGSYASNYYSMTIIAKGLEMVYEKILTTLTVLDFSSNKFEGDISELIGKLGSLRGLNLSHNLLTGHIPRSMGKLVDLEWLDLSSNKLVGQIPRELTDLTFLAVLNLSHNQLDGPIPQGKQFNTFENNSYEENSGLCGFPLSKACGANKEAPSEKNIDAEESASGFSWEAAYVGYGCGIVFGVLIGYLVFSSGSPQWLVRMVEGRKHRGRVVKRSKRNGQKRREKRIN